MGGGEMFELNGITIARLALRCFGLGLLAYALGPLLSFLLVVTLFGWRTTFWTQPGRNQSIASPELRQRVAEQKMRQRWKAGRGN